MNFVEFEQEVDRAFGFLQELGFSRETTDYSREFSVSFMKSPVAVYVIYELGTTPYVILEDRSVQEKRGSGHRRQFGLHELVQELAGLDAPLPETVEAQAATLRRLGTSVLGGDFAVLHARQRRLWEAVKGNHA